VDIKLCFYILLYTTMPRKPIDYSKSIIYKIVCNDTSITDCYVGSTTDLKSRKSKHKYRCNNSNDKEHNSYKYQFIRENGCWNNWSVIVVEELKCENKNQLETRQRYWLEELKATLNKKIPTRTMKEYTKEYYDKNKEEINAKDKAKGYARPKHKCSLCDFMCIKKYMPSHMITHNRK